ncbi:MAG TPA: hypothetical protein VHC22_02920 [Pirellulales bacterium]|nr:hypothetical protein [Pirellulales bacterium]
MAPVRSVFLGQFVSKFVFCLLAAPPVAAAQTAIERDLMRVRVAQEQQPWLTLNAGGHTATVNALAFTPEGKQLYSGGLDKAVHVWDMSAAVRDLRRGRLLERSLRWPVQRGLRGGIYALAVAPDDGLLAVAGYGASNETGEIWLIEPRQGTLVKLLRGHRQPVMSLAFSADGDWLASLDAAGTTILWRRGQWQPSTLYADDKQVYGAGTAAAIAAQPQLRPLAILGNTHLLLPVCIQSGADSRPRWKLQRIGLTDRQDIKTFDTLHIGMVTALTASADGRRWASADLAGDLFVWDAARGSPQKLPSAHTVLSLALTPDGSRLLAGTALKGAVSEIQLWDVATNRLVASRPLTDHVRVCTVSADGRQVAYSGAADHAVSVAALASFPTDTAMRGSVRRVVKVAFAKQGPAYRLAFGTRFRPGAFNDYGMLERSFDPQELALSGAGATDPDDWLTPLSAAGDWRAELTEPAGRPVLQLYEKDERRGYVNVQTGIEGKIRCYCFVPDDAGRPAAVAVGTDVQNSIYVCRLVAHGACPILRFCRGHADYVTSLSASRDGRYLASGSADGTVRIWSLSGYRQARAAPGRWGAEFAVDGGKLLVRSIDPAGPLFHKGVRAGDELTSIAWFAGQEASQSQPEAIIKQLAEVSWQTPVLFRFGRAAEDREPFQLLPAWQPLANLFANSEGEWAFWTPTGYYDASPNGHSLFGWQVNRGLQETPEFFRADQFRQNLERPDVLERLLPTGSLDAALQQAMLAPPAEPEQVVSAQILATPRITIATPLPGESVNGDSTLLRAIIDVPVDGEVVQAKAFANGVVARERRLVAEREVDGHRQLVYEWQLGLPAEPRLLVQVVAGSAAKTAALASLLIERQPLDRPAERRPRLYLLAVGVDRYRDPAIQPLAFAVADARSVVDIFHRRASGLYQVADPMVRVDEQVTRAGWTAAFSEISRRLQADVRPDDLLVIFMAGHGFVDPAEQRYYFASQDIAADEVLGGVYGSAISWDDFDLLADVPCRKLAFLDTCHSGAIQPQRDRDLKAAIRALQDDVVLTVAASAGHERSEEKPAWAHGAFTKALLEGLGGSADTSHDGAVSLDELIAYVKRQVPQLTAGRQNPAAAPDDLLPYVSFNLTEGATGAGKLSAE